MGTRKLGLMFALSVAFAAACDDDVPASVDARRWFDPCKSDSDCGGGVCVCERCTQPCTESNSCAAAGGKAVCADLTAPGPLATCAARSPGAPNRVCIVPCSASKECGAGNECRNGACMKDTSNGGRRDSGTPVGDAATTVDADASTHRDGPPLGPPGSRDGSTGPIRPVGSFEDVHVPQDFTEPVVLPLPEVTLSGDASSLVGSWVEADYAGQPCTRQHPPTDWAGSVCTHLDIVAESDGKLSATLYREADLQNYALVVGPFAPAKDPATGYPTELTPAEYGDAGDLVSNVKYRLFDGLVRDGKLTFWISPLDLWTGWCALQTPSLWDLSGKHRYRCVPQTATEADTDLGKLALCTSAEDMPYCKDTQGASAPCVCFDDTMQFNSRLPLCNLNYCECSATECHANLRNTSITGTFVLKDDTLVGTLGWATFTPPPTTLKKVSP